MFRYMSAAPTEQDKTTENAAAIPPGSDGGQVLACFHDEWEVALDTGEVVRSRARGRHFADTKDTKKPIVAGDRVLVSRPPDGSVVIESVLPRKTVLSRRLPRTRRDIEQVIVANAEQLVCVASVGRPRLNRRLLDRFLVIAEVAGLRSVVVINKIDLAEQDAWLPAAEAYERAGYSVVPACALDGRGVDELASLIAGRFSVFAGPSGVGKSSLLNAMEPGLGIKVREVSSKTRKGKHATTNVTVFALDNGALVADTPGFRELGFWRIDPGELDALFPEFRDRIPECRFSGCNHSPEPDCAVKEAVLAGEIDAERYDSYLRLLEELEARA
jgi:ribosome biogenesis GTPase